jgi:hypothetical protein
MINTPGFSDKISDCKQSGVETFQRCLPQNPGKFCTLINTIYLIDAQGRNLNRQLVGIVALSIVGAAKATGALSKEASTPSKYAATTVSGLKRAKVIKTDLKSEIIKYFSSSKIESTIQQLKNKPRINIKRLNIIH